MNEGVSFPYDGNPVTTLESLFSKSQVVCAIGDRIDYYENLFLNPGNAKHFRSGDYGSLKTRLDAVNWEYRFDEDHIDDDYVGEAVQYLTGKDFLETQKWFNKAIY